MCIRDRVSALDGVPSSERICCQGLPSRHAQLLVSLGKMALEAPSIVTVRGSASPCRAGSPPPDDPRPLAAHHGLHGRSCPRGDVSPPGLPVGGQTPRSWPGSPTAAL